MHWEINMNNIMNVFISTVTTGSTSDSIILNLSLSPTIASLEEDPKDLYIERTDIDINELKYDIDKDSFNRMTFNSFISVDEESDDIKYYKDHDNDIVNKVHTYLRELSETYDARIKFWVGNPLDWGYFTSLIFPSKENSLYIPTFIDPYPMDIYTFTQVSGYDLDTTYEKFTEELGVEFNPMESISLVVSRINRSIINIILAETPVFNNVEEKKI